MTIESNLLPRSGSHNYVDKAKTYYVCFGLPKKTSATLMFFVLFVLLRLFVIYKFRAK